MSVAVNVEAQPNERTTNRFQFHKYKWQTLHTDAFHIYFPRGYDSLCAFAARELPGALELTRRRMLSTLRGEPNLIIYPSVDQLYESNVGGFEPTTYTLPTVVLKGNRLLVGFTGSYARFRDDIREAVVRAVWQEQLKPDLLSQAKGSVKAKEIPVWFIEGAIDYFATGWMVKDEDALKEAFRFRDFSTWQEVCAKYPKLSGAAFCHFLNQAYYRQAVMQLYGQLKKTRSLPRALRLSTKSPADSVFHQCFLYYQSRFNESPADDATSATVIRLKHPEGTILRLTVSPDNERSAYVLSTFNRRRVYIAEHRTGRTNRIFTYNLPPWITGHSKDPYPQLCWTETGELIVALPRKGKLRLIKFGVKGQQLAEHTLRGIDGLHQLSAIPPNNLLMTAFRKGQSDIVIYDMRTGRYRPVTDDIYDDSDPRIHPQTGEVGFVSERPILLNTPEKSQKDSLVWVQGVFMGNDKRPLKHDTISYVKWDKPFFVGNQLVATTTESGREAFVVFDNIGGYRKLSGYQPFSLSKGGNSISFYRSDKDSITITQNEAEAWLGSTKNQSNDTIEPWLADYWKDAAERAKEDSILKAARYTGPSFLEGVLSPGNTKEKAQRRKDSILQSLQYDPDRISPYVLQLHSAYLTARVNNDYFINRYQPYLNYQGQFKFPQPGGIAQGGFTDLFENHHFGLAYRMPAGTEGSDFFVRYENTAGNTDWSFMWFRKVERLNLDPLRDWKDENGRPYPGLANVKTNYFEFAINRPVTYLLGVKLGTALRHDRTIFLATEDYSLRFDDVASAWSISTLNVNYHRLKPTLPMLFEGLDARLTGDLFLGFDQAKDALYGIGVSLEYHKPIWKHITAVAKLNAGFSRGSKRLLFNMGGVDNNLTVRVDSTVHFAQEAPYAFQTLITPLRGHLQNTVYGDQYLLYNTDVYFPLFQSLIPVETPLSFINNLQPGLFADIAFAKEGWVKSVKGKSVWSYGLSVRSTLAGYPIRFDMAWPGTFGKKPVWYLSLSLK